MIEKVNGCLRSAGVLYRDGGRYQVFVDFYCPVPEVVGMVHEKYKGRYIELDVDGCLLVKEGYAWDGPSGPAMHTSAFMRPSLVHDVLYELIRDGVYDTETADYWRREADDVLFRLGREDGMWAVRSWWTYLGVRAFGGMFMKIGKKDEVRIAPAEPYREVRL